FFIGVTVEEGGIKQNTFHYFGENFRQVNQAFEGLGAEFQSQKSMLNFVNVIACIVLALNLLVQGGLAVLCGINSFKAFKSGEKPSVLKYVLWAFVSFAITATVIYSLEYAYADTEVFGMEIEVGSKMSGGSIAGLIIGAIFLFIVYTMQKLKEGKAVLDKNYLIKLGIVTLTLIFAVITFSTLGKCVYKTFSSTSDSGMTMSMTMKYSAASYLNYAISETLGTQGVEYGLEFATVIVNMLAIAGAAVLFAKIFMAFMTDRELGKRDFITAIVATALSLVNLIVACVSAGDIGADLVGATFSAGRTVVPFIFSLLTLGAIIARGFFNKEKPTVEDNSKNEETVVVEESTSQIEEQTAK
ncbi:MAG: hypothetical protein IJV95_03275, partial [Clostridia bacterium]|nr:hypothetical protein [Clostridia bacterium]